MHTPGSHYGRSNDTFSAWNIILQAMVQDQFQLHFWEITFGFQGLSFLKNDGTALTQLKSFEDIITKIVVSLSIKEIVWKHSLTQKALPLPLCGWCAENWQLVSSCYLLEKETPYNHPLEQPNCNLVGIKLPWTSQTQGSAHNWRGHWFRWVVDSGSERLAVKRKYGEAKNAHHLHRPD